MSDINSIGDLNERMVAADTALASAGLGDGTVDASDVTLLDEDGHTDETDVESAAAEIYTRIEALEPVSGLVSLVAAGLGDSKAYIRTTNGAQTLLASSADARVCLIIVKVTTTFADGDGAQPVFAIGEASTTSKFDDGSALADATAGDIFVYAGTLTATKAALVTATAATGTTSTGAIQVTILALPATA